LFKSLDMSGLLNSPTSSLPTEPASLPAVPSSASSHYVYLYFPLLPPFSFFGFVLSSKQS
jgi:hypothetical protein